MLSSTCTLPVCGQADLKQGLLKDDPNAAGSAGVSDC